MTDHRAARFALACVAVSAGCDEAPAPEVPAAAPVDWPISGGAPSLRGVGTADLARRPAPLWTFATGSPVVAPPVVAHGLVYVGAADGVLRAIDRARGAERWWFQTGAAIEAPALVLGDRVFVGSTDGWFYALDAHAGRLLWRHETGEKIVGGANWVTIAGKAHVVVGSHDHKLYCFDTEGGAPVWTYRSGNYVNATPAVDGDRVVFGGCDAVLHVLSAARGTALGKVDLGAGCHVAASVALAGGSAFCGHYGNAFVGVDLAAACVRWSYPSEGQPFFAPPAVAGDRVVFGGRDRHLHCARADDGARLWTFPTGKKIDGAPVICGAHVLFGSADGKLYCVSLASGAPVWDHEFGPALLAAPAVAGDLIVVAAADGRVHALRVAP